ncbi:Unknown protein, partial [Striga hermonthica]
GPQKVQKLRITGGGGQPYKATSFRMKTILWNCRGLGGPSIVSQVKEAIRFHHPTLVFLSETRKNKDFTKTVCSKLGFENRWLVSEPNGQSRGLLLL